MRITFDRTIPTVLSDEQLWRLLVLSFRNSDESPIWPHDLETIRSASVESGALVRAVYKGPGPAAALCGRAIASTARRWGGGDSAGAGRLCVALVWCV